MISGFKTREHLAAWLHDQFGINSDEIGFEADRIWNHDDDTYPNVQDWFDFLQRCQDAKIEDARREARRAANALRHVENIKMAITAIRYADLTNTNIEQFMKENPHVQAV